MAPEGTHIEANGLKIYYEVHGQGEPLSLAAVLAVIYGLKQIAQDSVGWPYCYPWGTGALLLDQDGSPILLQQEESGER